MPEQKREGLEQLFVEDLQDLLDAEKQLVKSLPKMAKSASDAELANALREHLEVTRGQVERLEQVFESMEMRARSKPCKGMKGIVEEGREILEEEQEENILDSAITSAARKVEHYEMVGYESARAMAQQLGRREAAQLLEETLREEMQADRQLAQIAKRLLKESGQSGREQNWETSRGSRGRVSSSSHSRRSSGSRPARSSSTASRGRGASARPLTNHEEIRRWAEERGGHPACVRGTGGRGDTGMIRLDFPGYSGSESLQEISWNDWFEKFDERGLALMVQEKTARGQKSNFNKLVSRRNAAQRPKVRAAG